MFFGGEGGGEGTPPPQRDAWKKLAPELILIVNAALGLKSLETPVITEYNPSPLRAKHEIKH